MILVLLFILSCKSGGGEQTKEEEEHSISQQMDNQESNILNDAPTDFDFLIGEWEITNKRLKERLNNSDEWIESKAHSKCWKILGGYGNMDEFSMKTGDGRLYLGNTIRVYNSETAEWSLYWVDNFNLDRGVTYQTKGTFVNGEGIFYGEEMYKGKKVKQKFIWKKIDDDTAYWDQAYYDEKNETWEINWTMTFHRIKSEQ